MLDFWFALWYYVVTFISFNSSVWYVNAINNYTWKNTNVLNVLYVNFSSVYVIYVFLYNLYTYFKCFPPIKLRSWGSRRETFFMLQSSRRQVTPSRLALWSRTVGRLSWFTSNTRSFGRRTTSSPPTSPVIKS